jgi:hypothetical protein
MGTECDDARTQGRAFLQAAPPDQRALGEVALITLPVATLQRPRE